MSEYSFMDCGCMECEALYRKWLNGELGDDDE